MMSHMHTHTHIMSRFPKFHYYYIFLKGMILEPDPKKSQHGLLTTVAYQLGPEKKVTFGLEGAVSMAGQSVRWLKDNLNFFKEIKDVGENVNFLTDIISSSSQSVCLLPCYLVTCMSKSIL